MRGAKSRVGAVALAAVFGAGIGVAPAGATGPVPTADLRADSDRDGRVALRGSGDEAAEETGREAVFLPNLDDDGRRCRLEPGDLDRLDIAVDERLAACNDAANEVVDGPADERDLAPLRVLPARVGHGAIGRVEVPAAQRELVRLFIRRGGSLVPLGDATLTARELRSGVELAIEARDVPRDQARWDGRVAITLTVSEAGRTATDTVPMRVAPVLVHNDLQRAERIIAAKPGPGAGTPVEIPTHPNPGWPADWEPFAKSLTDAAVRAGLGSDAVRFTEGTEQWWRDIWRQDIFEPGTVSMPAPDGAAQVMRVLLRSPNHWSSPTGDSESLRRAGRLIFRDLRGPDIAVVQQYTSDRTAAVDDMLNFTGNFESVPAFPGSPQGRIVYGSAPSRMPDQSFVRMLAAQGQQPPIAIDTSWLVVGHADETVHVVRADNARGWTLMVADPRLAVDLLRRARAAGAGGERLFADTTSPNRPTVDELLAADWFARTNESAAGHIDGQLAVLLRETGLRWDELVRVPVLLVPGRLTPDSPERAIAFSPAIVNGLSLTARDFAAPDPHGPRVAGVDVFRAETERALGAQGVSTRWVENFSWAHIGGGEVHCATNALRDPSGPTPWWRERSEAAGT
ncbi:protein-arginine deiminase domain-containing protein (plasmid) [Embleya sp. NBC_00888]|uniref:protein-arginine deiminase family protein n=1 Tax=Embleya sp. NBC_00888 TaxID=2975960 RepID=UPI002F914CCA|nr:protein-arginine deiminase domain-containing protein [Embleya sp. NBC_00888]